MSTDERDLTLSEAQTNALMEISNAMVKLYKEYFGRGPTAARASWSGENL
jgi:uncharacterized protein YbcI